jgi:hypothetical protein
MATLTLSEKQAREIYPTAAAGLKTILHETFGEKFFSQKITDRVKTFEDACEIAGVDPRDRKFLDAAEDEIAYSKLRVIISVLNEGWTPDWDNSRQYKYYPWFYLDSPGFRLATCTTTTRLRLSAPAFASNLKNWLNMPLLNSNHCIKIISRYN